MAKPGYVRVDTDNLGRLAAQAVSLAEEIEARFRAIDQSIDDLMPHWAGTKQGEFLRAYEKAYEEKEAAVAKLVRFCGEALSSAPGEYVQVETAIQEAVQKLKAGQK